MQLDYVDLDAVGRQLSKVNPSQDSIGAASHYLNFHTRYCDQVMDIWKQMMLQSKMDHQLLLLYVVNDLIPISRRKSNCFVDWCFKELPNIWNQIRHSLSLNILLKIQRLFDAWNQRKYFPAEFISLLRTSSNENPFIFILEDVQKSLKTMSDAEKKDYLYNLVNNAEECLKELKSMHNQFGSPRQVSKMLLNIDQNALNQLLKQ